MGPFLMPCIQRSQGAFWKPTYSSSSGHEETWAGSPCFGIRGQGSHLHQHMPRKQALAYSIYYICGHQWSAGKMQVWEESCSKCSQNCSPSASLAWLMCHSTESFQGQGFPPRCSAERALLPASPAQSMQEGKAESAEQLPIPPHPELQESWEFSTSSCFWTEAPSGMASPAPQHWGESDGIRGLNTKPLRGSKVPPTPDAQKGPALGSAHPSCPGPQLCCRVGVWQQP